MRTLILSHPRGGIFSELDFNDRIAALYGFGTIARQQERLLKPETFLERIFRQLKTKFARTPTVT